MKKVLIIYRTIPQYRIEFYELLKAELLQKNIDLQLVYGDSHFDSRKDSVDIEWAELRKNRIYDLKIFNIIWQPCLDKIKESDFVIVEQANKLLINYILIFRWIFQRKKFAFWGHGLNLQISEESIFNRFKRMYINKTTWWFAYTSGIKKFLVQNGFDEGRITAVENSLDTKSMVYVYDSIPESDVTNLKVELNIKEDETVFIYCGAYYKEKRIDFLIEALDKLIIEKPKIKCLFIGSGPQSDMVSKASKTRSWMLDIGPKFGREKALYFKLANVFLHPGAMGLAILDSFAFKTPMITAVSSFHGPEFSYIVDDCNGVISSGEVDDYVKDIIGLLDNPVRYNKILSSYDAMNKLYNTETMVNNFVNGIEGALSL